MVVPVLESVTKGLTLGGFGVALAQGFQVYWSMVGTSVACEASKGYRGYDDGDRTFVCYCEDGPHAMTAATVCLQSLTLFLC